MDPSRLRKRQIARRLGVSEQILDQYLQLKRAEVLHGAPAGSAPGTAADEPIAPAGIGAVRASSGRDSSALLAPAPRRSGQLRSGPAGTLRGSRGD